MEKMKKIKQLIKQTPYVYDIADVIFKKQIIDQRKITNVMFYTTDRCNSLCKHCFIWNKKPNYDLPLGLIKDVLQSKHLAKTASFGLEGGEFFMHPKYEEILELFRDKEYVLYTNGILYEKVIEAVNKFQIKNIQISMEGTKETYKRMRGVDTYDNIMEIIRLLKGKTKINIAYTFAQWNTKEDYLHVKKLCEQEGLTFLYKNVYTEMYYMDTKYPEQEIPLLEEFEDEYLNLFNKWMKKEVKLPCWSINTKIQIWANGEVPMCQYKNVVLGNLHQQKFDEIWESEKTKQLQKANNSCNGCWVSYHRGFDLNYINSVKKVIPGPLQKIFVGNKSF